MSPAFFANAGELVPGTLQDLGRAVIVGDTHTFGKGSAQALVPFDGGVAAAVLTQSRFYRVTGASTQFNGVESDIVLPTLCDDMMIRGERGLDFPLPWCKTRPVAYSKSWDLDRFVPALREASVARRAESDAWKAHMRYVSWAHKRAKLDGKSLDIDIRRRQLVRSRAVDGAIGRLEKKGGDPAKRDSDPVLDEGLEILADLIRLNGGRKLPPKAETPRQKGVLGGLDEDYEQ